MAALFGQDIPFLDSAYHPRTPDTSGTQSFFQGWQRAQEGKRIALEQQQQEAMLPLQQKQAQLQIQNATLDLAAKTRMADAALNIKAGQAALADKLATTNWENPIDRSQIWDIGRRYPDLLATPLWQKIEQNFENSDKAAAGKAESLATARLFGVTTLPPSVSAVTANPIEASTSGASPTITPQNLSAALSTPGLEGKGMENIMTTAARYEMYKSRSTADRTPTILEAGGTKFLVNPVTGSAHEIKGPADQTALGIRATHDFQTAHNNWMGSMLKLRQQISDMGTPTSTTGKSTLTELQDLLTKHRTQEPKLEDYTGYLRQTETTPSATTPAARVGIADANGKRYTLPAEQVDSFLASPQGKGFKRLE